MKAQPPEQENGTFYFFCHLFAENQNVPFSSPFLPGINWIAGMIGNGYNLVGGLTMNILQMFFCHKKIKHAGRESLQRLPQGDSKRVEKAPDIWLPFAIRISPDAVLKHLRIYVKRVWK